MKTLNCKGKLLHIDAPIIMGIINATKDSFYTKDKYIEVAAMVEEAGKMLEEGAAIIDIGGMSTHPGAASIEANEEIDRVAPVIEVILQYFPDTIISIDSYRAAVAAAACKLGASIVNDISAGALDVEMIETVACLQVPYIAMHMQGTPANMQLNPQYEDVATTVLQYLIDKVAVLRKSGIQDIIIDPGFGFGKTMQHNYALLQKLHTFQLVDAILLVGVSRKSMLYKLLNIAAEKALNATTAVHMLCLQQGAQILRVHDVKEAKECITIYNYYKNITG